MLNGLDLFSGYGGISLALSEWVRPIVYCEIERYAQGILLSRMADGSLPEAPIWDDVRTLRGDLFKDRIDIVYGGFPCQDLSVAGLGKGLEGKRSGLFREIVRLAKEIKPTFLFLENVPAIRTRGLDTVIQELTEAGYDLRWTMLSAQEVGAPHKRERWFMLAHANHRQRVELRDLYFPYEGENRSEVKYQNQANQFSYAGDEARVLANSQRIELWDEQGRGSGSSGQREAEPRDHGEKKSLAHSAEFGRRQEHEIAGRHSKGDRTQGLASGFDIRGKALANSDRDGGRSKSRSKQNGRTEAYDSGRWAFEPDVGRVVDGCAHRSHRIKSLGNGVVPLQVRTAFKELMGITDGAQR